MSLARYWGFNVAACLFLIGTTGSAAHAALVPVPLTFSGGSGAPLTFTLPQSITYPVTAVPAGGILFDFPNVGNIFGGTVNASGPLTYSVNGGAANTLTAGTTGAAAGAIATNDLLLFHNPATGAALGNTIVLGPGSVTTAINIPAAAPASGSYFAILVDQSGNQIGVGVAPEPGSVSVLVIGGLAVLARRRREHRSPRAC